jgi:hypothetical protein
MRAYAEPIIAHPDPVPHGHSGASATIGDTGSPPGPPQAFLWRGRHYAVRSVVATWLDQAPWWRGSGTPVSPVRRCWRVEASAGMASGTSVVDLVCDLDGTWHLVAVLD